MGKIKENYIEFDMEKDELDAILYERYQDQLEYEEWLLTDGFIEYVNGEIDMAKPRYSESDIMNATRYASKQISIDPSEVGKEVYDMLFSEKIEEYLSLHL